MSLHFNKTTTNQGKSLENSFTNSQSLKSYIIYQIKAKFPNLLAPSNLKACGGILRDINKLCKQVFQDNKSGSQKTMRDLDYNRIMTKCKILNSTGTAIGEDVRKKAERIFLNTAGTKRRGNSNKPSIRIENEEQSNRGRINRSNNLRDVGQFNPTCKINKPCFNQIKAINNQQRSGSFTPIQSTFMSYESRFSQTGLNNMYNRTEIKNSIKCVGNLNNHRTETSPFDIQNKGYFQTPSVSYYNMYKGRGGGIYSISSCEPVSTNASNAGTNSYLKTNPIGTHHINSNQMQNDLLFSENQYSKQREKELMRKQLINQMAANNHKRQVEAEIDVEFKKLHDKDFKEFKVKEKLQSKEIKAGKKRLAQEQVKDLLSFQQSQISTIQYEREFDKQLMSHMKQDFSQKVFNDYEK